MSVAAPAAPATYDTPNGKKTLAEMQAGLHGAGWNGNYDDPAAVMAAYNSTSAGTSGGGGGGSTGGESAAQKLLDAIASGDQAKFDEAVKEYQQTFTENQRQYNQTQYTDLAKTLLGTASSLTGPADWTRYEQYTNGGRDLFKSMFGNQPMAEFGAPAGTNPGPMTIDKLMSDLGFTQSPLSATATAAGAPAGSYNTVNGAKTVDQMYQELKAAGWNGSATDTAGIVAAYSSTTKAPVTPSTATATPAAASAVTNPPAPATPATPTAPANPNPTTAGQQGMGNQAQTMLRPAVAPTNLGGTGSNPSPLQTAAAPTNTMRLPAIVNRPVAAGPGGTGADAGAPGGVTAAPATPGTPAASGVPVTPFGFQMNPAVWDSYNPTLKSYFQGAIEAANGKGTFPDWLAQMNAARPQGTAPGASMTSFSSPMGSFS